MRLGQVRQILASPQHRPVKPAARPQLHIPPFAPAMRQEVTLRAEQAAHRAAMIFFRRQQRGFK